MTKCLFSSDGHLAVGTNSNSFSVYDPCKDDKPLCVYKINAAVRAIDFDPRGSRVFFGGGLQDGKIRAVNYKVADVPLKQLNTIDVGTQISTIKACDNSKGVDLWVAKGYHKNQNLEGRISKAGIDLIKFTNHAEFVYASSIPSVMNSRVLNMDIVKDRLVATMNDAKIVVTYKMPQVGKH